MPIGVVRWFDPKKGYGFVGEPTLGDLFVHHTAITGEGFKTLLPNEEVSFDVAQGAKGLKAVNVVRLGRPARVPAAAAAASAES
jgi:CspA family cold shock protein